MSPGKRLDDVEMIAEANRRHPAHAVGGVVICDHCGGTRFCVEATHYSEVSYPVIAWRGRFPVVDVKNREWRGRSKRDRVEAVCTNCAAGFPIERYELDVGRERLWIE